MRLSQFKILYFFDFQPVTLHFVKIFLFFLDFFGISGISVFLSYIVYTLYSPPLLPHIAFKLYWW